MSKWLTPGIIRANLDEFKNLDVQTRWNAFGEIVYPKVFALFPKESGKITGMLIDHQTFTPEEILANIEDESKLLSLAVEAQELLLNTPQES